MDLEKIMIRLIRFMLALDKFLSQKKPKDEHQRLRILLAGYNGARNTGSDLRVHELVGQLNECFGKDNIEISIISMDPKSCEGYFHNARLVKVSKVFFIFTLFKLVRQYDCVLATEGSAFKKAWSSILTIYMSYALGLANNRALVSMGYGVDADSMDPILRQFVKRYCKESLILVRNRESFQHMLNLGMNVRMGSDTAWDFEASDRETALTILKEHGVNTNQKIIAVAPINPFCWPVKPSLSKYIASLFNPKLKQFQYESVYFHKHTPESQAQYQSYLTALADAIKSIAKEDDRVILLGMERLDRKVCEDLRDKLEMDCPVFASDEYNIFDLVAILRTAYTLISSRYHAVVTSMIADIPVIAASFDERINGLLKEQGAEDCLHSVSEPDLAKQIVLSFERIEENRANYIAKIQKCLAVQRERNKMMQSYLKSEINKKVRKSESNITIDSFEDLIAHINVGGGKLVLREVDHERTTSYTIEDLKLKMLQVTAWLREKNIQKGDRVLLISPNSFDWLAIYLSVMAYGAICVCVFHGASEDEFKHVINSTEPKQILADDSIQTIPAEVVRLSELEGTIFHDQEIKVAANKEDIVLILFTSGSTGLAKGAMSTLSNIDFICEHAKAGFDVCSPIGREFSVLHMLPLCFSAAQAALWSYLCDKRPFDLSADIPHFKEVLSRSAPNSMLVVPYVLEKIKMQTEAKLNTSMIRHLYYKILKSEQDGTSNFVTKIVKKWLFKKIKNKISPSLAFFLCGSAPLKSETIWWFEQIGIPICQAYGQTESTGLISIDSYPYTNNTVGRMVGDTEMKLDESGKLFIRGKNVFPGYWQNEEATRKTIIDGWLDTGDYVSVDEKGYITILGRQSNKIILSTGHNIIPESVEDILHPLFPEVEHLLVFGDNQAHLTLILSNRPSQYDHQNVVEQYNHNNPPYLRIAKVIILDEPLSIDNGLLTSSGKVMRKRVLAYLDKMGQRE